MRFLLNPISGQLNAAPSKEIVYSDTAPFAPLEGLRWADTTTLREYIFTDGYWIEVGVGFVGPIGPTGLTGATGTAATVAVGTTTTGAAGASAAVSNSGTPSSATLDFTIPKGVDGINGAVGAAGKSAYQLAVDGGYAFSEAAWIASLKGATGDAATVAVGTTTTGAAGTSAAVSNSGTTSAAVFNFTVPKGDVGATGTAATVAVGTTTTGVAGTSATVSNSGTTSAAVFNFTIPKGDKGADGTSVVIKGSVATSASLPTTNRTIGDVWITSDTGDGYAWSGTAWSNVGRIQGPACTVAVGTTTTGVAGSLATVSNSGTTSAATFNFTIPKGDTGEVGPQGIKGDTGLTGIQGPAGLSPSGTGAVVVSNGVLQTPIVVATVNTASTIVQRDASGNFSAGTITGTFSGNVTGNVTGTTSGNAGSATKLATARTVNVSGDVTGTAQSFDGSANITIPTAITADSIVNADINSAAAIADTKLATIATAGKVSNSATTATSANAANAIVARDNSGNFSAGTITANLTGSVSGNAANVTGIVAVANGGTGSTTAAAALIALGAAATSHQHGAGDITSGTLANAQLPARLQAAAQTITDWNNAVENGWYQGSNAANAPEGVLDWWLGCVETHYDRWVTQTVHRFTQDAPTNTQIWRRSSADSGATVRTFSAWYKLQLSQGEQDARYAATTDARLSDARTPTSHTHDDRYYTETQTTTLLAGKSATTHTHDDRYYTETETTTLLADKSATTHTHTTLNSTFKVLNTATAASLYPTIAKFNPTNADGTSGGTVEFLCGLQVGKADGVIGIGEPAVTVYYDDLVKTYVQLKAEDGETATASVLQYRKSDEQRFALRANGSIYSKTLHATTASAISVNADGVIVRGSSDERLKENIATIEGALSKVNQMRGVYFDWRDKQSMGSSKCFGLIAQEVKKVIPEAVYENPDGHYGVHYAELVGLLINAVNELKEEVNELRTKL